MFKYRVECVNHETETHEAMYIAAENADDAVECFRRFYDTNYIIIEVSRCINRDWSKK